jgi:Flp pilus assembly protein TadD
VPARDDLHLVYPATKCRTLGGEHPYPIQNGRDMSWYRNHERPNDIFALDVTEDFFGCYYEDLDVGLVHWSDHRQNVGKKFFTWGTADEGMIWVDLLTDDDGQYVELQSGRFVDQSTFEFLAPYQCVKWTEYWYPLHGMGGFSWADDTMAVRLEPGSDCVHVAAMANTDVGQRDLVLEVGHEEVWRAPCRLGPAQPFRHAVPFPTGQEDPPELRLSAVAPGQVPWRAEPFAWRHEVRRQWIDIPQPELRAADDPEVTPRELVRHARHAEKYGDFERAEGLYERALEGDASLTDAHVGLGLIEYRRWGIHQAMDRLANAVAADPDHDEALYYLGAFLHDHGDRSSAQDAYRRLIGRGAHCAEALAGLAMLQIPKAPAKACELLTETPITPTVRFVQALSWRLGAPPPSDILEQWRLDDPLCPLLAAEQYLDAKSRSDDTGTEQAAERLASLLCGDPDLWLEVAVAYDRLRLREDAAALLDAALDHIEAARTSVLVGYWRAALDGQGGSRERAVAASALEPECCFPGRRDDMGVLNAALHWNPSDWKAHLLQGNACAAAGDRDRALSYWQAAAGIDDRDFVLCRNLGLAYHLWQGDQSTAREWYAKAVERRPEEFRLYLEQDNVLRAGGAQAEERLGALVQAPPAALNRWETAARRVECLVELGRWDEALVLMQAYRYRPWEGARQMHALWTRALTGRAAEREQAGDHAAALADYELALTYPRNLGVGCAAYPQEARIRWLAAECAGKLGDEARRQALLQGAADERHEHVCEADLFRLRALRALDRAEEADALTGELQAWATERLAGHPEDALARRIGEETGG